MRSRPIDLSSFIFWSDLLLSSCVAISIIWSWPAVNPMATLSVSSVAVRWHIFSVEGKAPPLSEFDGPNPVGPGPSGSVLVRAEFFRHLGLIRTDWSSELAIQGSLAFIWPTINKTVRWCHQFMPKTFSSLEFNFYFWCRLIISHFW